MRGLQELPPPICRNYINKYRLGTDSQSSPKEYHLAHPAASDFCLLRQGFLVSFVKR